MARALTTEEFIANSKKVHGDKFDYTHVVYVNKKTPVEIICPNHGAFSIPPAYHLKQDCGDCSKENRRLSSGKNRITTEEWISRAKAVHGDRYDYSVTKYVTKRTKISFICKIHGERHQFPQSHLKSSGCKLCSDENMFKGKGKKHPSFRVTDTKSFITKATRVHQGLFTYDRAVWTMAKKEITVTCPVHGDIYPIAKNHLWGFGCKHCAQEKNAELFSHSNEDFVEKCRLMHGDRYDYSSTEYISSGEKVVVICPDHGPFSVLAMNHQKGVICEKCWRALNTKTRAEFIELATKIHGDFYNYCEVDYINNDTKVIILCPKHGPFTQLPRIHNSDHGCTKCNEVGFWDLSNLSESQQSEPNGLYILHMRSENHTEEFIKIGISNNLDRRIKEIINKSSYVVTALSYIESNRRIAIETEKQLHDELYSYQQRPLQAFQGLSECISVDVLPILKSDGLLNLI
jgi:hypothetical protein